MKRVVNWSMAVTLVTSFVVCVPLVIFLPGWLEASPRFFGWSALPSALLMCAGILFMVTTLLFLVRRWGR